MSTHPGGEAAGRGSLFSALKNSTATLVAIGKTRLELLVTEIEEEKLRLMSLWSKAIGAAFLLTIGIILAVFSLALAFWEQRVFVFGLFAALFLGGGIYLIARLRGESRQPSKLFRASLTELEADIQALRRHVERGE